MMTTTVVFILCIICFHATGICSAKPTHTDIPVVSFSLKPKYSNIKDYLDVLKVTVARLDDNFEKILRHKTERTKEEIKLALSKPKRDCKSLYDSGFKTDGVYRISPDSQTSFDAFCDMSNGGWTVIQRRKYGDVSFDRLWVTYAEGFGDLEGDHWLGLRHLHELTKNHPSKIHFRFLMTKAHANATALYNGFYIDDEAAKFRMHVKPTATYNSEMNKYVDKDKDNFFYYHNNMKFSTKDQDNDMASGNCASNYLEGPFWYKNCWRLRPNAKFSEIGIWTRKTDPKINSASRSEIKIKRM